MRFNLLRPLTINSVRASDGFVLWINRLVQGFQRSLGGGPATGAMVRCRRGCYRRGWVLSAVLRRKGAAAGGGGWDAGTARGSRGRVLGAAVMVMAGSGQAAVIYWDVNTATATTWGATTSWTTSPTVADQSPAAVPTNTDSVVFGLSSITNTNLTVNLGAARSVIGMDFLGTNAGTTLLQAGGTNFGLTLGTGGVNIASGSGAVTIGSATGGQQVAVTLGAAQSWRNDSGSVFTVVNGVANGGNLLTVLGSGNTAMSGVLSGTGGVTKDGAGILTLSGANTYTGATTVSNGTLRLDYATNNNDKLGTTLVFGGGTIDLAGGSFAQTVTSSTISAGASEVTRGSGTSTLGLGTLTRTAGATLNLASGVATTGTANVNGIVGTWATVGGADWATGTTSITALAAGSYTAFGAAVSSATANYSGTAGVTRTAALTFNTLKLASSAGSAQTLALGAQTMSLGGATSGLLVTGSDAWTISGTGDIRTSANNSPGELIIHQYNTGGLTITAPMVDRVNGAFSLTKTGTGLLTLSGAKTYTGATTLNEGTLRGTGNAGALGAGVLAIRGGVLELANDTGLSFGRNTTISGDATILSDRVTAGAGVTHTLGTLSIGAQTLTVDRDATVTSGTAGLTFGATALSASGTTFSVNSGGTLLTLGDVTGTNTSFTVSGAGDTTFSGIVGTGTGTVAKSGAGTMTLSGANTYTGAMTISGGVVNARNATALGTAAGGVTVANGAALEVQGGITIGAEALGITGSGVLSGGALRSVSGVNTYGGAVTVGAGTLIGVDAGSLALTGGLANGAGSALTKVGAGTLIINSANSLTGIHTINGGILRLGASGSMQTVAMTLGSGTTFDLNGRNATLGAAGNLNVRLTEALISTGVGTLSLTNGTTVTSNAGATSSSITGNLNLSAGTQTFAVADGAAANDLVIGAVISNGSLEKSGAGTLTLSGSNSFAGGLGASAGTLRATTSPNALGAGALTLSGAGLELANNTGLNFARNTTVSADTTVKSDVLTLGGGGVVHTLGTLSIGANTLALTVGGNVLAGSNYGLTFGGTTVASGSVFDVANNGAGVGTLTLGALSGNVNFTKQGAGVLALGSASVRTAGVTTVSAGTLSLGNASALGTTGASVSLSGGAVLDLASDTTVNAYNVEVGGDATIVSNKATAASAGIMHSLGTLTMGANTLSVSRGANATGTGGVSVGAVSLSAGGGVFDAAANSSLTLASVSGTNTAFSIGGAGTTAVSGVIGTGTGGLTKTGAGNLTLSGANTYGGGTTLSGGTLTAGHVNAFGTGAVTVGASAVLDLANFGITNTLTNNGGTILNAGTIAGLSVSGGTTELTGAGSTVAEVTGTATVNVAGPNTTVTNASGGTLNVSASDVAIQSYNGGTLNVNANGAAIQSYNGGNIVVGNGRAVTINEGTSSGTISGGGTVNKAGSGGTLVLASTNTYTGGTTLTAGTLSLGSAGAIGTTGTITFGGGTLQATASNTTDYSARFSAAASQQYRIDTNSQSVALATALTSSGGSLTKLGGGTLTLSGANTYTGTTTISGGILQVGAGGTTGSLGSGAVTNDGTLVFNRSNGLTISSVISGSGAVVQSGSGTLELSGSGANDYTGATTVTGGVLKLNKSGGASGAVPGTLAVTSGGTVEIAASEQIGDTSVVTVGSGAVFSFSGSGMTETVGTFTNTGGDFSTGANNLVGTGNSIYWQGGTNTINEGGSVSDQHFLVTAGTNTVEAGGVMTVLSGGVGLEFGGTSSPTILLNASDAVAGKIILNGNVVADMASGTAAILSSGAGSNPGNIVMGGGVRTVTVSNGSAGADLLVTARMSDGSLIKAGAGTLELGAVNSLTGLTVNGGTVLFGVDNAVSGNVTMDGGTLALGGTDASAGVFTLTSASVLDMGGYAGSFTGSGAGLSSILTFANTNATNGWTGLKVFNWDGAYSTGGGNDQILFSSFSGDQTSFSGSQVQFYSDGGTTAIGSGGQLVTSGSGGWELVPVPEPSTVVGVLGLIGMAAWRERRHLLRCPEAVAEVRVRGR